MIRYYSLYMDVSILSNHISPHMFLLYDLFVDSRFHTFIYIRTRQIDILVLCNQIANNINNYDKHSLISNKDTLCILQYI